MYKILRTILFFFDAEKVHHFSMNVLVFLCKNSLLRNVLRGKFRPHSTRLSKTFFGLTFSNPVGLAAGFDKNAKYLNVLEILGFGFIEIGTVTPLPQQGNEKPRLFRLPKDEAIINRMGFNNDGVKVVAERLRQYKKQKIKNKNDISNLIVGGNIGKNKITKNENAWKDYEICFNELHDVVDYFVVNVSSPNTPGLRDLQQKDSLKKILTHLQEINRQKRIQRPLLLKISPDLSAHDLDDIIDLAMEIKLDGFVAANTTIGRNNLSSSAEVIASIGAGGLSGRPLTVRSNKITNHIYLKTKGTIPIISSGGIFNSFDAQEKFDRGASLIQVWTGFIYEGPGIVKRIVEKILEKNAATPENHLNS